MISKIKKGKNAVGKLKYNILIVSSEAFSSMLKLLPPSPRKNASIRNKYPAARRKLECIYMLYDLTTHTLLRCPQTTQKM